jgi:hypothetical protein
MVRLRTRIGGAGLFIGFGALLVTPSATEAQTRSLSWTEQSRVEMPGTMGLILRAVGGASTVETRQGLHIQGRTMIQEDDDNAVVVDLDQGRYLIVDHRDRTFLSLTFDEIVEVGREALSGATTPADDARAEMEQMREEMRQALEENQARMTVRVRAENTGRRQTLEGGINAVQHALTTEFELTAVPEGVEEREGGTMVMVTELWQTTDVPSMDAMMEAWARELASGPHRQLLTDLQADAEETQQLMASVLGAWNPEIGAGLVELAEAIGRIEGTSVRSVTTVAMVPLGVEYDRAQLMAWEPASMGAQLTGAAAGAARAAATDAARGALRGLSRGALGRGGDTQPDPAPARTAQPLFRMITTKQNVRYEESSRDVVGDLTTRIADYRELTRSDLTGAR